MSGHSPVLAHIALEQKFHANRIDGRDLKRLADGRIRSAASSLDQDVATLAERHANVCPGQRTHRDS